MSLPPLTLEAICGKRYNDSLICLFSCLPLGFMALEMAWSIWLALGGTGLNAPATIM